jgi:hypothetical protein
MITVDFLLRGIFGIRLTVFWNVEPVLYNFQMNMQKCEISGSHGGEYEV